MFDKKEFLLDTIIKAYISTLEPIGSSQIKQMYDISYSSATIRGYFKKLGDDGFLIQEHISSGRIPTTEALKQYWDKNLRFKIDNIDYNKMCKLADSMDLTIFIKQQTNDTLYRVLNIDNTYMILEFYKINSIDTIGDFALTTQDEAYGVTIKFNIAFYKFLQDMIGRGFDDILEISRQVGARDLYMELSNYIQNNIFETINIKDFLNLAVKSDIDEKTIKAFIQGDVVAQLGEGLYLEELLPDRYMGICHNTMINSIDVKILVVGDIATNYEHFYKEIKYEK